jgi:hypothetical protein
MRSEWLLSRLFAWRMFLDSVFSHDNDRSLWRLRHRSPQRKRTRIGISRLLHAGLTYRCVHHQGHSRIQEIFYQMEQGSHVHAAFSIFAEKTVQKKPMIVGYGTAREKPRRASIQDLCTGQRHILSDIASYLEPQGCPRRTGHCRNM